MKSAERKQIDYSTELIQTIIKNIGINNFSACLNNAFVHGEVLTAEYNFTEDQLGELYKSIESFRRTAQHIEQVAKI